jgi:GST-like protein
MLDLYTWGTPNGYKASIMLEECGLPYTVRPVNLREGQQRTSEFLALNPNAKIPVLVDKKANRTIFESGAILLYLAELSGLLMPKDMADRYAVIQWLMWQVGGVGPMFGQASHFARHQPANTYGVERYQAEANRLLGVLNEALEQNPYVAGDYSIADIMIFPWVSIGSQILQPLHSHLRDKCPHVMNWMQRMAAKPAVIKGMTIPHPH